MNRVLTVLFVALMVTSLFAGTAVAQEEQKTIEVGDLIEYDGELRSQDPDVVEVRDSGVAIARDTGRATVRFVGDRTVEYIVEEGTPDSIELNTSDVYVDERTPYNVTATYTNGSYTVERDVTRKSEYFVNNTVLTVNTVDYELVGQSPGEAIVRAEFIGETTQQTLSVDREFIVNEGESVDTLTVQIRGTNETVSTKNVSLTPDPEKGAWTGTINLDEDEQSGTLEFFGGQNTYYNGTELNQTNYSVEGQTIDPAPKFESLNTGYAETYTDLQNRGSVDPNNDIVFDGTATETGQVETNGWVIIDGDYGQITIDTTEWVWVRDGASLGSVSSDVEYLKGNVESPGNFPSLEDYTGNEYEVTGDQSEITVSLDRPATDLGTNTSEYVGSEEHTPFWRQTDVSVTAESQENEFTSQTEDFSDSYDQQGVVVNGGTLELETPDTSPTIDGTGSATQPAGDGLDFDPYQVTTVNELAYMLTDPGGYYELQNDLVFPDPAETGLYGSGGWSPIVFEGTLDGQGYRMTNFFIDRPGTSDQGLFDGLSGGTAKNFLISGDVTGGDNTAIVAGSAVTGATFENLSVHGTVDGGQRTGGVLGQDIDRRTTVNNVHSDVDVLSTQADTGGIAGLFGADMTDSFYTGNLPSGVRRGGVVGYDQAATYTNVYYNSDNTSTNNPVGPGLTTSQMTGSDASTNMNLDFSGVWEETLASDPAVASDSYPTLRSVDRPDQLRALGVYVASGYWTGVYTADAPNPYNVSVPQSQSAELRITGSVPDGTESTVSPGTNVSLTNDTFYVRWDLTSGETVDQYSVEGDYGVAPIDSMTVSQGGQTLTESLDSGTGAVRTVELQDPLWESDGRVSVGTNLQDYEWSITGNQDVYSEFWETGVSGSIDEIRYSGSTTIDVAGQNKTVSVSDGEQAQVDFTDLKAGTYRPEITSDGPDALWEENILSGQFRPVGNERVQVYSNDPESIVVSNETVGLNETQELDVRLVYPSGRTESVTRGYNAYILDGPGRIQNAQFLSSGQTGDTTVEVEYQEYTNTTTITTSESSQVDTPSGAINLFGSLSFWWILTSMILVPIVERFREQSGPVFGISGLVLGALFSMVPIWVLPVGFVMGTLDLISRQNLKE